MKKQNKIYLTRIIVVVAIIIVIVMFSNQQKENDTIKIGVIYSLSGPLTFLGEELQRGTILAEERIIEESKYNIEVFYEDHKGLPQEAISAANKLIEINNVDYIISDYTSTSQAIAPLVKEANKFMIYVSSVNSEIAKQDKFIFKEHFNLDQTCAKLGQEIALNRNITTLGVLRSNEEWNEQCIPALKKELNKENITVYVETFLPSQKDVKGNILKLTNKNVEGFMILSFSNTLDNILRQLDILYKPELVVLSYAADSAAQTKFNIDYFNKTTTIGFHPMLETNKITRELMEKYERKYNSILNYNTIDGYDGLMHIYMAFKQCEDPKNYNCVREKLLEAQFKTSSGIISFDEDGILQKSGNVVEFDSGEWRVIL
jgi:branched-chain amino acid transport system substrate-binding protein